MMMVIIVEVLSFLPKIKTEKRRAVKKVSERFVWEQGAEKKTCPSGLWGIKVWFEAIEWENDEGG